MQPSQINHSYAPDQRPIGATPYTDEPTPPYTDSQRNHPSHRPSSARQWDLHDDTNYGSSISSGFIPGNQTGGIAHQIPPQNAPAHNYNPSTYGLMPGTVYQHTTPSISISQHQPSLAGTFSSVPTYQSNDVSYNPQTILHHPFQQHGTMSAQFHQGSFNRNDRNSMIGVTTTQSQNLTGSYVSGQSGFTGTYNFPGATQHGLGGVHNYPTTESLPQSTTLTVDERHYIPLPSMTGEGMTAYIPGNINSKPGDSIPLSSHIPTWTPLQQSTCTEPLKKFRYTPFTGHPNSSSSMAPLINGSSYLYHADERQQVQHYPAVSAAPGTSQSQIQPFTEQTTSTAAYAHPYHQALGVSQNLAVSPPLQSQHQSTLPMQDNLHQQYGPNTHIMSTAWNNGHQDPAMIHAQQADMIPAAIAQMDTHVSSSNNLDQSGWRQLDNSTQFASQRQLYDHNQEQQLLGNQVNRLPEQACPSSMECIKDQTSQMIADTGRGDGKSSVVSKAGSFALRFGGPSDWEHFGSGIHEEVDDIAKFTSKSEKHPIEESESLSELPSATYPDPERHGQNIPSSTDMAPPNSDYPSPPVSIPVGLYCAQSMAGSESFSPTPPPVNPQWVTAPIIRQKSEHLSSTMSLRDPDHKDRVNHDNAVMIRPELLLKSTVDYQNNQCGTSRPLESGRDQRENAQVSRGERLESVIRGQSPMNDGVEIANEPTVMPGPTQISLPSNTPIQDSTANLLEEQVKIYQEQLEAQTKQLQDINMAISHQEDRLRAKDTEIQQLTERVRSLDDLIKSKDKAHEALNDEIKLLDASCNLFKDRITSAQTEIQRSEEKLVSSQATVGGQQATINRLEAEIRLQKIDTTALGAKFTEDMKPWNLTLGLDPWYVDSLGRYMAMLRQEASALAADEKIRIFTDFIALQSRARGIPYRTNQALIDSGLESGTISIKDDLTIGEQLNIENASQLTPHLQSTNQPPEVAAASNPASPQYSPGGRPLLRRETQFIDSDPNILPEARSSNFEAKVDSTSIINPGQDYAYKPYTPYIKSASTDQPVLTPTSSTGEDHPTSMLATDLPGEECNPDISIYQAYTPQEPSSSSSLRNANHIITDLNRSKGSHPTLLKVQDEKRLQEESFLSGDLTSPPKPRRGPVADSHSSLVTYTSTDHSLDDLLEAISSATNASKEDFPLASRIVKTIAKIPEDYGFIDTITHAWEAQAAVKRRVLEDIQRTRQEESESRTNQLFEDNEITYSEIGALEDKFRLSEQRLKAEEDKNEYQGYVSSVFDPVFSRLQDEVGHLMGLFVECQGILLREISGQGDSAVSRGTPRMVASSVYQVMQALLTLHNMLETRHERIFQAVIERDKRYKRTEIQPLYASGNITKMKTLSAHFDQIEKETILESKRAKADRLQNLCTICEDASFQSVAYNQSYRKKILDIVGTNEVEQKHSSHEIGPKACRAVKDLAQSCKDLLAILSVVELRLASAGFDVNIAKAKVDELSASKISALVDIAKSEITRLQAESREKRQVIDQDLTDDLKLLEKTGQLLVHLGSEQQEQHLRLQAALEDARRRNGEA